MTSYTKSSGIWKHWSIRSITNLDISLSLSSMVSSPPRAVWQALSSVLRLIASLLPREAFSFYAVHSEIYTLAANGWYSSPLYAGTPASPGVSAGRGDFFCFNTGICTLDGNGITGSVFGEYVTEVYFCHRFSHIFEGACSRVAEEVFAFARYCIPPVIWW